MEDIKDKLIEFLKDNIDNADVQVTYSRMCIERAPLRMVNNNLYNKLSDLVDDFLQDNDITDEWFEETFIDIEDLFDYL